MVFSGKNLTIEQTNVMKGVAILAVVVIHMFNGPVNSAMGSVSMVLDQLARFAVPVFFVLSGIGLERSGKANMKYVEFVKIRLSKLLLPYLTWTIIYHIVNGKSWMGIDIFKYLFLGKSSGQMYFVVVIMSFYIMYPFIRKIAISKMGLTMLMLPTLIMQMAAFLIPGLLLGGLNPVCWLGYFALGVYAGNFDINISKVVVVLSLSFGLFSTVYLGFIGFGTSMKPTVIVYTIGLMFFMTSWTSRFLQMLGKHSFNIYLSHLLVIMILVKLIDVMDLEISTSMTYPIVIVVSLVFSMMCIRMLKIIQVMARLK